MRRGDLVTVAVSGDYGKPRPALVAQADAFDLHPSVIVLPLTSEVHDAPLFRVSVTASAETGLRKPSQIMVDKATTVPRVKIGPPIGSVDDATLRLVDEALRGFLGL
jgi:mRNA interferase MazF